MTIAELHAFLVDCCRRGISADTEILVDAESEADGLVRLDLVDVEVHFAHDGKETPFLVMNAEEPTELPGTPPESK